ncbi:BTAD domain-containing putative transcriptional regulator [Novosphingobium sp. PhB165]|uniref:BTAD domain-containing putative transcriptional regulator n=1 Tax=Novosphingobium sp. PhB165 TaxID=2485105 RepID=UPI001404A0CB|nr:BTAD domain-containing putative transcriptional regulator [Novosphingobium sp. PhB165]
MQARASLRQALKELRELSGLGEAFAMDRDAVHLDGQRVQSDLDLISKAAHAQDLEVLATVLGHSHGDVLEDFLDLSPRFDEWLMAERVRLREQVLEEVLDALRCAGLHDMKHAREILRSLDRLEPANEAAARLGMRLDHDIGDGSSLHRRYRELCNRLDSEFGARPSARTRELFHSLAEGISPSQDAVGGGGRRANSPSIALRSRDMMPLVLVSPLRAQGQEDAVRSFGEACVDEIRSAVCQFRGLHVLALDEGDVGSVVAEAEHALAIYSLSGNVRQIGSGYQASLQLANAASHVILWAETIRLAALEIEAIDMLVEKASGVVLPAIDRDLERQLWSHDGELAEEGAKYTRARLLIRQLGDLESVKAAVALLEELVEEDPAHIAARLLLVRMYNTDFWQQVCGHDVQAFREASERHLREAVKVQPGHCEVRLRQAWCELRKGNVAHAEREFKAALAALPNDPDMVNMCAFGMCHLGLFEAAEDLMQRAFRQNPFPPSDYHADYAVLAALRGFAEDAEAHFSVSGEMGLQYTAVRMANAVRLDDSDGLMAEIEERFRDAFLRAWQQPTKPQLEDVMEWVDYTLPLNPIEHRTFIKSNLAQILAPRW